MTLGSSPLCIPSSRLSVRLALRFWDKARAMASVRCARDSSSSSRSSPISLREMARFVDLSPSSNIRLTSVMTGSSVFSNLHVSATPNA
jgi:hypothetical protein